MQAISDETLGAGSVAFGEYIKNMKSARITDDGIISWIEICFCSNPLKEEKPYWEKYFYDIQIEDAQEPSSCKDFNGEEKRACFECDCTNDLEMKLTQSGRPFLKQL